MTITSPPAKLAILDVTLSTGVVRTEADFERMGGDGPSGL